MKFEQGPRLGLKDRIKKEAKRTVLAVSMVAAGTQAFADQNALKKLTDEKSQEGTKIEMATQRVNEIDESKLEQIQNKNPDELTEEEFRILVQHQEQEQMESAKERAENIRGELIQFFASQEFFEKLRVEYDGDEKRAREVQMEDINNLKTVEIIVLTNNDYRNQVRHLKMNTDPLSTMGCYGCSVGKDGKIGHSILINANASGLESEIDDAIRHEFIHAATEFGTSKKAAEILTETYQEFDGGNNIYNISPAERLARKQALERDLVRLNIKKYGEKFTEEHYKKMMEAYNSKVRILLPSSKNFIKRTKPNFENFKKIFDKIADSNNIDNSKMAA